MYHLRVLDVYISLYMYVYIYILWLTMIYDHVLYLRHTISNTYIHVYVYLGIYRYIHITIIYCIYVCVRVPVCIHLVLFIWLHSVLYNVYTTCCFGTLPFWSFCELQVAQPVTWLHHNGRTRDHVIVHSGHKTSPCWAPRIMWGHCGVGEVLEIWRYLGSGVHI